MNKRAFTLIELLVTSSILVSLIVLTSSIFASVGRLQVGRKGSEGLAVTARQFEARLEEDIQRADHLSTVTDRSVEIQSVIATGSVGAAQREDVLVLRVALQNENGTSNGSKAWHVYCNDESLRRLVRHRFLGAAVPDIVPANFSCTENAIKSFLSTNETPVKEYLVDDTTTVTNLKFIQVKPVVADAMYDATNNNLWTVPVIRYEMRLQPIDVLSGVSPLVATGVVTRTAWHTQILP
jgi:prepilin-type N-terminal cleavage/methylation domain-containing protein